MLVRILIEILAISLVGGLAFGTKEFFVIAPIRKDWTAEENSRAFVLLPLCCYLAFRAYFGIVLTASKFLNRYSSTGKFLLINYHLVCHVYVAMLNY